jgi:hydroxyacylglutathione hydrolase
MKVTKYIHALKIPFQIPIAKNLTIERFVYVYLIFAKNIYLIDSGVAGSAKIIFEHIKKQGRKPEEITHLIFTHAHPDHIGSAKSIKEICGCKLLIHEAEAGWIEDVEKQSRERPVPGFHALVEGSVSIDENLHDGYCFEAEEEVKLKIVHTPGHSKGSISIFFENDSALFCGDTLLAAGDIPIYENIVDLIISVYKLKMIHNTKLLLSSWEAPIEGEIAINRRITNSLKFLEHIHKSVCEISSNGKMEPMELCKLVVNNLGLPPAAINPLVAKGFISSFNMEVL